MEENGQIPVPIFNQLRIYLAILPFESLEKSVISKKCRDLYLIVFQMIKGADVGSACTAHSGIEQERL